MDTHYLRWFKTRPRVRFDLTASGVASVTPEELNVEGIPVALEGNGVYGDPDLIQSVAKLYGVRAEGVVPVPGTSSANVISLKIATEAGDTVLLEHPCYDPLQRAASFLGLGVIPLARRTEHGFGVSVEAVENGLHDGARAVVLSNLHNPSGRWLSPPEVHDIAECCAGSGATLIVDEVYLDAAHVTGRGPRWSVAGLAESAIGTGSLTKVYGLGGLRAGWILTNPDMAERARDVMDVLSVENAAPAAALALHGLSNLGFLEARYLQFHRSGEEIYRKWLSSTAQIAGYANFGALFEWIRLPVGMVAEDLNEVLVREYDLLVVPGRFFGAKDHIRINIGLRPDDLREALGRLSAGIQQVSARGVS